MEQQQFRVSLSVGTKLLLSVVSLLLVSIVFLDFSTIFLLIDDKRNYTYQSQSTEALLIGREFTGLAKNSLDTLRISLVSVDPRKPITPQTNSQLQSIVENQSELVSVAVELLQPQTGDLTLLSKAVHSKLLESSELGQNELALKPAQVFRVTADLMASGYAFLNLSVLGKPPLMGIVIADREWKTAKGEIPIAVGFISLKNFGKEIRGSDLTVATESGDVVFSTSPELFLVDKTVKAGPLYEKAVSSRVASGTMEYEVDQEQYLGSYFKPGYGLVVTTRTEWRKAMRSAYAMTEKFILLGAMAIGAAIIFAILFAKRLTAPINRLYQATMDIGAGNFNVNLEVPSKRDEIGALTASFNAMSKEISELILHKVEMVYLENEVAIASTVQQTLLPPPSFSDDRVLVHSHYQAATQCGGDWWGFFGVGNKMCFMIADATGHGLPSALITASARSCFSVMHKLAEELPEFAFSPGSMLAYANRVIHDAALGKIMMTFFIGVVDFDQKTLTYSSAGHNPPWLFKKKGEGYTLKSLVSIGQRLGEARDVEPFEEKTVELDSEDILFLYTDGVLEGKNTEGTMFGKKNLKRLVESELLAGPEKMVTTLVNEFMEYNKGKQLDDDVTLAAVRFNQFTAVPGNT